MVSTQQQAGGEHSTVLHGSLPAVPTSACLEPAEEAQDVSQARSAGLGLAFVFPPPSTLVGQLTAEEELTSTGVGKENVEEKKKIKNRQNQKGSCRLNHVVWVVWWGGREGALLSTNTANQQSSGTSWRVRPEALSQGLCWKKGAQQN